MPDQQTGQKMNTTIAFTVGFENHDPNLARQVANELVSLYLAENVRSRTEQTAQTSQFMQAEVDRLDGEVRALESQMAKLKQENEGSLPEQSAVQPVSSCSARTRTCRKSTASSRRFSNPRSCSMPSSPSSSRWRRWSRRKARAWRRRPTSCGR